jgi:hypothetical protein
VSVPSGAATNEWRGPQLWPQTAAACVGCASQFVTRCSRPRHGVPGLESAVPRSHLRRLPVPLLTAAFLLAHDGRRSLVPSRQLASRLPRLTHGSFTTRFSSFCRRTATLRRGQCSSRRQAWPSRAPRT